MTADKVDVTFETTTRNGYPWDEVCRDYPMYEDWDWGKAWVDTGGTLVWGPGPYLKVAYIGDDPDMNGTVSRVRPKHPRKPGKWDFVRDELSVTGWSMVKK